MNLILPSNDTLEILGEDKSIGRSLFSKFLLIDSELASTPTPSSTWSEIVDMLDWMEFGLVQIALKLPPTFSSTSLEIIEMCDWMEFSLVMTLLGRTPSSFVWAMFFVAMCLPWFCNKRRYGSILSVIWYLDIMQSMHNLLNWFLFQLKKGKWKVK